jgi:transposase
MDVKDKQQAVIEFLMLEGCSEEEIVTRLQNVSGSAAYCHASVFKWINEVCSDNEELRNKGRPGRLYRHETDAAIRSILQEGLNVSLRTIAESLLISRETVRTHIGGSKNRDRGAPHSCQSVLDFFYSV